MTTTTQLSDKRSPSGLMRSWLENESGTYVPRQNFPFEIMCPNIVVDDDYGVKLKWSHTEPVRLFPLCAEITWASYWCRRGVVITDDYGAYFGFSTAGNGTDVYMTWIPNSTPEYSRYVIPVLRLAIQAVCNRLNVDLTEDNELTEPYIGWGDELS